jgi:hypothetical protein
VLKTMDARRFLSQIGPLGIVTLLAIGASATEKPPVASIAKPTLRLTGPAANITLDGPWTSHRIVTELPSGKDVTAAARYTVADPKIATVKDGTIYPIQDGRTSITINAAGRTLVVPVDVRNVTTKATMLSLSSPAPTVMAADVTEPRKEKAASGSASRHSTRTSTSPASPKAVPAAVYRLHSR